MTRAEDWKPDILGRGFQQCTLQLEPDHEGEVVATLVRHHEPLADPFRRGAAAGLDVLYVHGWSDYFFQRHLAEFWTGQGAHFYALDLRKYGRSLRPHQTPGFTRDLRTYDEDIEAALDRIEHGKTDLLSERPLVLMGHSTGGLVLSLWAAHHPVRTAAVVLNSPWLEFQAHAIAREAIAPIERVRAQFDPLGAHPKVDLGFYTRSVSRALGGEWDYDSTWRPERGFATHPAWLSAIFAGQAEVAAGLAITAPVLTLLSSRSTLSPRWSPAMMTSDVVLDVDDIARAALRLGSTVTVARIDGALHDVTLSAPGPREAAFQAVTRWLRGYRPG
ncbi:alpha/beta hydrolase [Rathayibacter sp. YIM 133350]|uniref:alpha/beta hydrolase n=1 Tax=Rathayibacter sp. YIM 133350 TaxID=3131992 RepID=UPI00307CEA37